MPQKIAIWNTAFLGDALLSLPLIHSLHRAYPQAELDFYVRQGFQNLFKPDPCLTRVFGCPKGQYQPQLMWQAGQALRSRKYDLWVGAHSSWYSGFMAFLTQAKERVGYATAGRSWLYTKTIDRQFGTLHERDRLLELLRPLEVTEAIYWPKLSVGIAAEAEAQAFYAHKQGPFLGIHPGSVWPTKRWLPEYFAEVAKLAAKAGAEIIFFGGPGEERMAESVLSQADLGSKAHNLIGKLTLNQLAAHIKGLNCYLTNDSGPMHMAWLQETPVTAIFGPTVTNFGFAPLCKLEDKPKPNPSSSSLEPKNLGAPNQASHTNSAVLKTWATPAPKILAGNSQEIPILQVPLKCRPCGLHGSKSCALGHHNCMRLISVEQVWQDVAAKLWNCPKKA